MDSIFNAACGSGPSFCDTLGVWLGVLLTLLVFSYLVRDTFLFRLASSLLVGTAIGYGSAVILRTVLWDGLFVPLFSGAAYNSAAGWPLYIPNWQYLIPLALGVLLLTKLVSNWSTAGNVSLGYLFGVGAALAIGGALSGALVPQLGATILSISPTLGLENWVNNLLIVLGSLGALLAFRFSTGLAARPLRVYSAIANVWGNLGRGFILVAFGAIFATTLTARVSALVGQVYFILHDALHLVK
jgi:hypothetical protein